MESKREARDRDRSVREKVGEEMKRSMMATLMREVRKEGTLKKEKKEFFIGLLPC